MAKGDFNQRANDWMRGRYGVDELSNFLTAIAFVLIIINLFVHTAWLSLVGAALLVYALWRVLSTSTENRRNENEVFLDHAGRFRPWLHNPAAAFKEARTYKHAMCPDCGQKVRVPRGKGKLRVTCPKCHKKFEVKS